MQSKRTPKRWFYVASPIASALLTLAIIEAGLALFRPVPQSIERNMFFDPDPYTGYKLRPGSIGYFHRNISARANANSHRDDLVSIEKAEGVFRVIVLGDSFTVGVNVEENEAYPEVLESLLNDHARTRAEVINTGTGGWQPFQYAQYYEHYGHLYSPDLVLVGFFVGNDTYDQVTNVNEVMTALMGHRISRKAAAQNLIRLKVYLYDHLNIARLVLYKGPVSGDFTRRDCDDFTDQYLAIQKHNLDNHRIDSPEQEQKVKNSIAQIVRIKELAERKSIPVAVVLIPDENQINTALRSAVLQGADHRDFDFSMPQKLLEKKFAEASIPTIDLLQSFIQDPRCLYMNDTHWTAEGHALAASIIYDRIVQWGIYSTTTR